MTTLIRAITRMQDADDTTAPAAADADTGKVWAWNHATGKFVPVLRADVSGIADDVVPCVVGGMAVASILHARPATVDHRWVRMYLHGISSANGHLAFAASDGHLRAPLADVDRFVQIANAGITLRLRTENLGNEGSVQFATTSNHPIGFLFVHNGFSGKYFAHEYNHNIQPNDGFNANAHGNLLYKSAPNGEGRMGIGTTTVQDARVTIWRGTRALNIGLTAQSSTAQRLVGGIAATMPTATDASRTGRVAHSVSDWAAGREYLRGEATGSAVAIGFLGADAVPRQAAIPAPVGGTTEDTEARQAIDSIISALTAYGLLAA